MAEIGGTTDSREISKTIKDSARTSMVREYGEEKLPYGELSDKELIVVEGRADVLNLLKAGIKNVIAMNGTKLPDSIRKLSEEKEITLFVDGDRGGKLIVQNVVENARIKNVCVAPDGKEVEELSGKEILQALRKRISAEEFLFEGNSNRRFGYKNGSEFNYGNKEETRTEKSDSGSSSKVDEKIKVKIKEIAAKISSEGKAVILDENLEEIKNVSLRALSITLKRMEEKPFALIFDGLVSVPAIKAAEETGIKIIAAKNFTTTDTKIQLIGIWILFDIL